MSNQIETVEIKLNFSASLSAISGRDEGKECYEGQIKNLVEPYLNEQNIKYRIIFPDFIELVNGSYLLGMFERIFNIIGIKGIINSFSFEDNTGSDLMKLLLCEIKRSGY